MTKNYPKYNSLGGSLKELVKGTFDKYIYENKNDSSGIIYSEKDLVNFIQKYGIDPLSDSLEDRFMDPSDDIQPLSSITYEIEEDHMNKEILIFNEPGRYKTISKKYNENIAKIINDNYDCFSTYKINIKK